MQFRTRPSTVDPIAAPYRLSGRWGPRPWALPLVSWAAALPLGAPYGVGMAKVPLVGVVSVVLVFALGFVCSIVFMGAARIAKCRSPFVFFLNAATGTALTLYVSWVAFELALIGGWSALADPVGLAALFFQPLVVWETALSLNEAGWYSVMGFTPTGWLLFGFWVGEVALVAAFAVVAATLRFSEQVYCETCDRWAEAPTDPIRLLPAAESDVDEIARGGVTGLEALPSASEDAPAYLQLDFQRCPSCRQHGAYRVVLTRRVEERGKERLDGKWLTGMLALSPEGVACLEALAIRGRP